MGSLGIGKFRYSFQDKFADCLKLLRRAEDLLRILSSNEEASENNKLKKLISITFNNIGCYYKK